MHYSPHNYRCRVRRPKGKAGESRWASRTSNTSALTGGRLGEELLAAISGYRGHSGRCSGAAHGTTLDVGFACSATVLGANLR